MTFSDDPYMVIPEVVSGVASILSSAAHEPSIKRFVLTSSAASCSSPHPGKEFNISSKTWNDDDVEAAWRPPPYTGRGWTVYAASKTLAERALWEFIQEKKPHFTANAVLPNLNLGPKFAKGQAALTSDYVTGIYYGRTDDIKGVLPRTYSED
jgi:nucleoside-diphosphate-sugar epimerase